MDQSNTENTGKIDSHLFKEVLQPKCGRSRESVVQSPAFGVDTSVIDIGNGLGLAVSSDPLSLIPALGLKESAWLTVHLMANDMATTGHVPEYVQFVFNLPSDFSVNSFKKYWNYIHEFCDKIGIAITGGHTGGVPGQNSTTPGGGTMFLKAPIDKIITSAGAATGDIIIVTKESALAASSILAKSFPKTVQNELGQSILEQARHNFYQTSVLSEALAASSILDPVTELKAMHDVTEGGILGAIAEMAKASGCGFNVYNEQIPSSETTRKITQLFSIDHRISLGAGSMIMAVKQGKEQQLITKLQEQDIPASVVGKMTDTANGFNLIYDDKTEAFNFNEKDPYWDAFYKATEDGWR